jgi:hypothetical protein
MISNIFLIEQAHINAEIAINLLEKEWVKICMTSSEPFFSDTATGLEAISQAQRSLVELQHSLFCVKGALFLQPGDTN